MSVNDVSKDSYSSISFIWLYKKNLFPIYLYWYYCSLTFPCIHSLFCKEKKQEEEEDKSVARLRRRNDERNRMSDK